MYVNVTMFNNQSIPHVRNVKAISWPEETQMVLILTDVLLVFAIGRSPFL